MYVRSYKGQKPQSGCSDAVLEKHDEPRAAIDARSGTPRRDTICRGPSSSAMSPKKPLHATDPEQREWPRSPGDARGAAVPCRLRQSPRLKLMAACYSASSSMASPVGLEEIVASPKGVRRCLSLPVTPRLWSVVIKVAFSAASEGDAGQMGGGW